MKSRERATPRESFEGALFSVARAYGFTTPPVAITRKEVAAAHEVFGEDVALIATVAGKMGPVKQTTQAWGVSKRSGGSAIVFVAASPKVSIAQAFVVKAALGAAESGGINDAKVLISSVGDAESRKRYLREVGNFFKKYSKEIPEDVLLQTASNLDAAVDLLLRSEHPLADSLPRTIDYLSESSRKIMLETITLFERLGIAYELEARLPFTPDVSRELVFAIQGVDASGEVVRVAQGGRIEDSRLKKQEHEVVGIALSVPHQVDPRSAKSQAPIPACFVVHVGEAAKLKAFTLLDSLWRAQVSLGQALLAETIQDQMGRAKESQARYIAIIGQREALDNTVIVKNVATELQETMALDKLPGRMSRVRT